MNSDKAALLQFLGTFHAQAKETEKQIVDMKSGIRPISDSIKEKFAQVLGSPAQTFSPEPITQPIPQLQYQEPVSTESQLELNLFSPPIQTPYNNDRVIELLSKINSNLDRIYTTLTKTTSEEVNKTKKQS